MRGLDERVLRELARTQQQLQSWAPGIGDGRTSQQQRLGQLPHRDPSRTLGRGITVVVAASNASDKDKAGADIVCDHVDDQDQVNAAVNYVADATPGAGRVHLTAGDFQFTAPVVVPPAVLVSGDERASYVECVDCNGFEVPTSVAQFEGLYIWNSNLATRTTRGITATESRGILFDFGRIDDCEIYQFDRNIDLVGGHWLIERNLLWGYDNDHHNGWGVYISSNVGRSVIFDNAFVGGKGAYLDGLMSRLIHNRMRHTDSVSQPWGESAFEVSSRAQECEVNHNYFETSSRIPSPLGGQRCRFIGNSGGSRIDVTGDDCRVALNYSMVATVYGDRTVLSDNDAVELAIDAAANDTRVYGNRTTSYVDAGTGTLLNLDGSANNWNF